uniref:(northern house mosquito) hypothetical protein n=1 Tax=Culex pipiens TaxID=7175 RepID=A0A8D8IFB7_CULPI
MYSAAGADYPQRSERNGAEKCATIAEQRDRMSSGRQGRTEGGQSPQTDRATRRLLRPTPRLQRNRVRHHPTRPGGRSGKAPDRGHHDPHEDQLRRGASARHVSTRCVADHFDAHPAGPRRARGEPESGRGAQVCDDAALRGDDPDQSDLWRREQQVAAVLEQGLHEGAGGADWVEQ